MPCSFANRGNEADVDGMGRGARNRPVGSQLLNLVLRPRGRHPSEPGDVGGNVKRRRD